MYIPQSELYPGFVDPRDGLHNWWTLEGYGIDVAFQQLVCCSTIGRSVVNLNKVMTDAEQAKLVAVALGEELHRVYKKLEAAGEYPYREYHPKEDEIAEVNDKTQQWVTEQYRRRLQGKGI